jgi:LuxR family transcriptional regulator, maltose regulon positive regulatory protein
MHQRESAPEHAERPAFDLLASKLRRPMLRPGTVRRSLLIKRLTDADGRPIVSVVAPAGYGKTTLLSQWAERSGQPLAWVSVDEADNDPKVLLSYIAHALNAIEPIGDRVFEALASRGRSVLGSMVPRLASAFSSMTSPIALVLDDVHVLRNSECRAVIPVLADHVPDGSRLVLAARAEPPLRTARLRAEGKILEIGPGDLALTPAEAASLLRGAGVTLSQDEVAELHQRTEGWPVGLYLAALFLREGGSLRAAAVCFSGDDRLVSEYMESEFLARISRRRRAFLTRTAVLERMCGPLCDAVLEAGGSAATLAALARSNLLLVPLDRRGEWYRYHHLFRDTLMAGLERHEPELAPVLRRRAAGWCSRSGLPEEALEYSMAAQDVETAARLVEKLGVQTHRQARFTTLRRWFRWLEEEGGIEGHPMVAVLASLFFVLTARPTDAERWADVVDQWQYGDAARPADPFAEAHAAQLRAIMCRRGIKQMRADAEEARQRCAAAGIVAPAPALFEGIARVLSGDLGGGDACFADAVRAGEAAKAPEALAVAYCERSLVSMARGQWRRAGSLAGQADTVLRQAGIEDSFATLLVCAVRARAAMHGGVPTAARRELARAQRVRPMLTYAHPQLSGQARIELTRVHLALGDVAGAKALMHEIDELLERRPGLGTLVGEAQVLRTLLAAELGPGAPGPSALTAAELRLLPMLSTHLSFPEVADELLLSPNTIRSQTASIYRKLGVTTRSQAVARSRDLGLIDG